MTFRFEGALAGIALLAISCGGSGGQTGAGGSGVAGGAGGQTGGAGRGGSGGTGGSQTTGTDGGGTCLPASPCGGDLVGTWQATQSCLVGTADLSNVCPGATTEIHFTIGGTVTFNADGTYTSMPTAGTATFHEYFPSGCMPYGQSCAQVGQSLADGGTTTGTCSMDATGGCSCDGTEPETLTTTSESGTYSTSGMLTLMHDGGSQSTSYCVQGDHLYQWVGPGDGAIIASGGLVYTKQ